MARPVRLSMPLALHEPKGKAMFAVLMAHVAAMFALMHHGEVALKPPPAIAFTVTLTDMSASQNNVSTAASATAAPQEKQVQEKTAEPVKPVAKAVQPKKAAKPPVTKPVAKTEAPQAYNSQQQQAVIAPLVPAQYNAAYLQNPPPAYPALSRRMGEQGKVMLSVYVNEQGQPETVNLKLSSGFERLDSAAIDAVKHWRFAAAHQGERMLASWVQVPVNFVLE